MELSDIVALQKEFDEKHGWNHTGSSYAETIELINKDIVGIIGELGEFSNIIKKLNLLNEQSFTEEFTEKFREYSPELQEELIDAFIYLIRLSSHLNMDLSKEYLIKYNINKERFKKFENT